MLGLPRTFEMVWHLGPLLSKASKSLGDASIPEELIRPIGFTNAWTPAEIILSDKKITETELEKSYVGRGINEQRSGILVGNFGKGKVCACGGHPEFGMDVLLENPGVAAKIFVNFILWATSNNPIEGLDLPYERSAAALNHLPNLSARIVQSRIRNLQYQIRELVQLSKINPDPEWLKPERAEATFGLTAKEKWPMILERLSNLPSEIESDFHQLLKNRRLVLAKLRQLKYSPKSNPRKEERDFDLASGSARMISELEAQLVRLEDCLFYKIDRDKTDYGYQGVLPLLTSAREKISKARARYINPMGGSADPYSANLGLLPGGTL